ncbi:MAG: NAD-dependent epimerase/dehydratase family protein [Candidatus Melainabacteria bacterium]|nr:NAD-dependent epimerase/dehydratase family protein [Candidatus Melainabacteria bacterium]
MTKIFITGGTGFIGGNLVKKLLDKDFKVKVLVRNKKKLDLFPWKDSVDIIYGDILEPETFNGKINDCEIIIHCAALIAFWNRIWNKLYKINVTGTRNILNEALKSNCKKFIHISSVAAIGYGENGEAINENHPYNWDKHKICYMETKHEAELEVLNAIKKGLNATMVNPANVWGVGDYKGRRTSVIKALKCGLPFYVEAGTNFVDVDAVCEGIINSIEFGKCGERYILGGENLSIKDFLSTISDEIKTRRPFVKLPKLPIILLSYAQEALGLITNTSPRPAASQLCFFGKNIYYDSSKAIRELKMPVVSFRECIHKTIRFYKEEKLL